MKYVAHWPLLIFSLLFLSGETCFDSYFLLFFQTIDCLNNNVTKFCNGQDKYLYIDFEFLNESELSRANFKLLVTAEKVYKCKLCFLKNQWCCTHHQCTITEQSWYKLICWCFVFSDEESSDALVYGIVGAVIGVIIIVIIAGVGEFISRRRKRRMQNRRI